LYVIKVTAKIAINGLDHYGLCGDAPELKKKSQHSLFQLFFFFQDFFANKMKARMI